MNKSELAGLRLFQLISPSLPVGAFTYSQGMEWAVEAGWVTSPAELEAWLDSVLRDSLATLELPLLLRLYDACLADDGEAFERWSLQLLANRETQELRQEELNRARAMIMVLNQLPDASGWNRFSSWRAALDQSQAAVFALAAAHWGIDRRRMALGYTWSWLENAVTVAIKLIPLGQSDGQRVLHRLAESLPAIVDRASELEDDDIGASTPALAIASSLHETQYTRLFRS